MQSAEERVACRMEQAGMVRFGICSFADLPPLLPCRAAARLPQNARSVLVCLFPYYVGDYPERNLSRYAIVDDYHAVTRRYLERARELLLWDFPEEEFACFVDSSPLREVSAAYLAGLGFIGRNGQLITRDYGSYCFIGEIVTTMELHKAKPVEKGCDGCQRCVKACPNNALGREGKIALARCRSHITQKKGELSAFEQETIRAGNMVWGCDICTDCCPYNQRPALSPIPEFYEEVVPRFTRERPSGWVKTRAYGWRGGAVLERNLQLLEEKT